TTTVSTGAGGGGAVGDATGTVDDDGTLVEALAGAGFSVLLNSVKPNATSAIRAAAAATPKIMIGPRLPRVSSCSHSSCSNCTSRRAPVGGSSYRSGSASDHASWRNDPDASAVANISVATTAPTVGAAAVAASAVRLR